jgi:hypothetical protein
MSEKTKAPEWLEKLFSRLAVSYGQDWRSMWAGLDPVAVQRDWYAKLALIQENKPQALAYALEHLPERVPTAEKFKALCLMAPSEHKALAAPFSKPNAKFAAEVLARLKAHQQEAGRPADAVARRLEARRAAGERLSAPQLAMLQAIAGGSGPAVTAEADRALTAALKDETQRRVLAYAQSQGLSLDVEASLRQRNAAHAAWIASQERERRQA